MAVLVQWLLLPRGTLGGGRGMLVRLLGPFYLVVTWSLGHHPAAPPPRDEEGTQRKVCQAVSLHPGDFLYHPHKVLDTRVKSAVSRRQVPPPPQRWLSDRALSLYFTIPPVCPHEASRPGDGCLLFILKVPPWASAAPLMRHYGRMPNQGV